MDRIRAVEAKLAGPDILAPAPAARVALDQGRDEYLRHVGRPRVVGGARPRTVTRYRPVFAKFVAFAAARGVRWWDAVTTGVLEDYAAWLHGQKFADAPAGLELNTLKQTLKWLVAEGRLPADHRYALRVTKPRGTTTWCWRPEEVAAMAGHCRAAAGLGWVGDVLVALACTELRVSELAGLRWGDVDRARNVVSLTDESRHGRPAGGRARRETKSGRDRSFPIHAERKAVLDRTPRDPADDLVFHGRRVSSSFRCVTQSAARKPTTAPRPTFADRLYSSSTEWKMTPGRS